MSGATKLREGGSNQPINDIRAQHFDYIQTQCKFQGCKQKLTLSAEIVGKCKKCSKHYCPKHRHPESHTCKKGNKTEKGNKQMYDFYISTRPPDPPPPPPPPPPNDDEFPNGTLVKLNAEGIAHYGPRMILAAQHTYFPSIYQDPKKWVGWVIGAHESGNWRRPLSVKVHPPLMLARSNDVRSESGAKREAWLMKRYLADATPQKKPPKNAMKIPGKLKKSK